MQPQHISLQHQMSLIHLPGEQFRTGRLTGVFSVPLRLSTAAGYAILPGLLSRCCEAYPTVPAFNRRLDDLYGASLDGHVIAPGGWQTLVFSVNFLNQRYVPSGEDLTQQATQLLLDILFRPVLENGVFREEDFNEEKRCLLERLQSEFNNKRLYARRRCKELLCPDHPFSLDPNGTEETVAALTATQVADARKELLANARIHWIYQGDTDIETLARTLEQPFQGIHRCPPTVTADNSFTIKQCEKTEQLELKQAKLVLGFRIAAAEPAKEVMAARIMNALWGGSPSSLLFKHVREEQSLCYYCASAYDRFQGVILVDSGVEAADADKAKTEILKQLDAIREGNFSDEELEAARRSIVQYFSSLEDTPGDREGWYVSQTLYDTYLTPKEVGQHLMSVTKEDICRAARLTHFDTAYLLKPIEEEGNA